jgi:hypothetical protein
MWPAIITTRRNAANALRVIPPLIFYGKNRNASAFQLTQNTKGCFTFAAERQMHINIKPQQQVVSIMYFSN